MLRSVDSSLFIDFSGQLIGPNLKSQAVQEESFCFTFEDEIDSLSRNVDK